MPLNATQLQRLSGLLDEALALEGVEHEAWLANLPADAAGLGPILRRLLGSAAARETADLIDHGPHFTAPGLADSGPAFKAGDRVGPYVLQRELGRGGMGDVWLAERNDGQIKRAVALKLPMLGLRRGVLEQRFARERDILAGLDHPLIARLYDAGIAEDGQPWLALQFVEGKPLDVYCREHALGVRERLQLLLQVADAVAFAHSRLVLHRDLKPANILVTAQGQVRLLDFGIAKLMEGGSADETALTQASGRALTPDYASPEQIRGQAIGTASDVYSLGVVAYELLAGVRPYRLKRGTAAELEEAVTAQDLALSSAMAESQPLRARLRGDIDAILNKALKKDAAERYVTIDALAQDWRRHLDGQRVLARPDSYASRLLRAGRRHRVPLTAGALTSAAFGLALGAGATALVIGVLLAGLGGALWQARKAREQAQLARAEGRKAAAVKRFLLDIFATNSHHQADPLAAQKTSARELLDVGVRRIDESLRDEPETRTEVLGHLAELYFQIGLRTEAARLHVQAVKLASDTFGRHDMRFAREAITCARALEETERRAEVPALLEAADAALLAAGEANGELRGILLQDQARHFRYEALDPALRHAEQAAALMRRIGHGVEVANACRIAGRMRLVAGHFELAEQHYRHALAVPLTAADSGAGLQVNGHAELAEALLKQGRQAEAEQHARTALEVSSRIHGPDHRWTMGIKLRLANQLLTGGSSIEAMALRAEVEQALADERGEYDSQFRADMASMLSFALVVRGRPDLAEPLQRLDHEDLRQHFANSYVLAASEAALAEVALTYGRYAQAQSLLEGARIVWQRYAGGQAEPVSSANHTIVGTRLAMVQGDVDKAWACVAADTLPTTAARGRFHRDTVRWVFEKVQVQIARGFAADAAALADGEWQALRRQLGPRQLPDSEAKLLLARAQARRALGDATGALADLRAALALRRPHDDTASLWLAELLVALAEALADGVADVAEDGAADNAADGVVDLSARAEAAACLAEAAEIHAQHPPLAAHLAAALVRARQRLSL